MTLPWRVKTWNGSAWIDAEVRTWNGSSWVAVDGYFWDGSSWVLLTDRTPPIQFYTTQWATHYGASYTGSGSRRTDSNGLANNYQGYNTSTWGTQRSMWGYDVNMQASLAGIVAVDSCFIFLDNTFTYYNAGGTAVFGGHEFHSGSNNGIPPTTFTSNRNFIHFIHFDKGEAKWTQVSNDWTLWAADGSLQGLTLWANSTDSEYYGYYTKTSQIQHRYYA